MKTFYIAALLCSLIVLVIGLVQTHDQHEIERMQAQQQQLDGTKLAAHQLAQELHDKQLLDDSNHMMFPCCQATERKESE
jgi:hypothetical protein